ncbi:hypothetical protein [Methanofollis fontis]|uniref:Uncharacterized protein n=1 Tax=Methanofollis fontis TaxID=2052832 RepID=A0A483CRW4_9EURY|nr:hypothetical protein [Methanofollis fontis]TAJ43870.1 hypothetical protein CUJ86_07340 [Methanofollis fontis]
MRRNHADDRPGTDRGGTRNNKTDQNGSSHDTACANTGPGKTASLVSAREEINSAGPVPLYLLPVTLSTEIHRFGGAIREVLIRRSGRHMYAITILTQGEAE